MATTLGISANFGMMALSHYYPNASMGLLTSITVAVALAVNFFFCAGAAVHRSQPQ
ncbi:MAG: hypothetical protein R3F38_15880 [Gammaproteobacteria bacterium]